MKKDGLDVTGLVNKTNDWSRRTCVALVTFYSLRQSLISKMKECLLLEFYI